jgi:hypothetical protein
MSRFQNHTAVARGRSVEKSNDLVGNRTYDIAADCIVPQVTTLPSAPRRTVPHVTTLPSTPAAQCLNKLRYWPPQHSASCNYATQRTPQHSASTTTLSNAPRSTVPQVTTLPSAPRSTVPQVTTLLSAPAPITQCLNKLRYLVPHYSASTNYATVPSYTFRPFSAAFLP